MSKSDADSINRNRNHELQELLIRREQQAFDRLQKIIDNYDALQKQLQDANSTVETTRMTYLDIQLKQRMTIERLKLLRQKLP